jgi:methylated-DNA-protein-cysteine methyltransferase-like protein
VLVGIDVSATRGLDVAVLDAERRLRMLAKVHGRDALAVLVRGLPPDTVVAVDAPPAPARGLVAGGRYRVAERALHALGVSLYPVPSSRERAAAWMQEGFAVFEILASHGFPAFAGGPSRRGVALEVYPHLTYRILAGGPRGGAAKLAWSRAALGRRVPGLPRDATQDQLDAVAAALTAWFFAEDRFVCYGDAREGVIIAPRIDAPGRGRRAEQLALDVGGARGSAAPAVTVERPSFAARVLGLVARIPPGRVATFGDLARWSGRPGAGRAVGTLVARHAEEVASHRVVDAAGRPSPAFPGGPGAQLARLAAEGVPVARGRVDLGACRWRGPA